MQWVRFGRAIVKREPIASSARQDLRFVPLAVHVSIDRPPFHTVLVRRDPEDSHRDHFVRVRGSPLQAKVQVVPGHAADSCIPRLASPKRIFHPDSKSAPSHIVGYGAENPHTRVLHFDNRIDPFAYPEFQYADAGGTRHRIAVQRHHMELVPRQMQFNVFRIGSPWPRAFPLIERMP